MYVPFDRWGKLPLGAGSARKSLCAWQYRGCDSAGHRASQPAQSWGGGSAGSRSRLWSGGCVALGPGGASRGLGCRSRCPGSSHGRGPVWTSGQKAVPGCRAGSSGSCRWPEGAGGRPGAGPRCRGQRGRARGGRCAGLYNTYIIRALLSAGGWEGRPAVEDWVRLFSEQNKVLLVISCPDSGCRGEPRVPVLLCPAPTPSEVPFPVLWVEATRCWCVLSLCLSWVLQQVKPGGREFEIFPYFHLHCTWGVSQRIYCLQPSLVVLECFHTIPPLWEVLCADTTFLSCMASTQQLHQLPTKNILKIFHLYCIAEYRMSQRTLAVASLRVDCCAAVREPLFFMSQVQFHSGITYPPLQLPAHWGNIT